MTADPNSWRKKTIVKTDRWVGRRRWLWWVVAVEYRKFSDDGLQPKSSFFSELAVAEWKNSGTQQPLMKKSQECRYSISISSLSNNLLLIVLFWHRGTDLVPSPILNPYLLLVTSCYPLIFYSLLRTMSPQFAITLSTLVYADRKFIMSLLYLMKWPLYLNA